MRELLRIHFGYSRSKRYPQALELAKLATEHKVVEIGGRPYHIVVFSDDQIDLVAAVFRLAHGLRPAVMDMIDEGYWKPYQQDMIAVRETLVREGYLVSTDPQTGRVRLPTKRPVEYDPAYGKVRDLIAQAKFKDAVDTYYAALGPRYYDELHDEFIYLKRLARIPLLGRDLLYYRSESSRPPLVRENLSEYCDCIDMALQQYRTDGLGDPLQALVDNAPTMQDLIQRKTEERTKGVRLRNGVIELPLRERPVSLRSFSAAFDDCHEGRLFDKYPDPLRYCRILDRSPDTSYGGLWTTFGPNFYKKEVKDKGLRLLMIEAYKPSGWRKGQAHHKLPLPRHLEEMEQTDFAATDLEYTGRECRVGDVQLYEINVTRANLGKVTEIGNAFLDLTDEVLRCAENILREKHGLPRIGEGWVSEMLLYDIVKSIYQDAELHVSPVWLSPQHLDVYVPSRQLAFEHQGRQHYEPVDFFGGELAFERLQRLDERKKAHCDRKGVTLVYWRYDEPLVKARLIERLQSLGLK